MARSTQDARGSHVDLVAFAVLGVASVGCTSTKSSPSTRASPAAWLTWDYWVVQRKTAKDRLSRTLRRISMWCSSNRHRPIKEQHAALVRKLRGHDAYYGITGNARALVVMRQWVRRIWQKWLNRRSWKAGMTWTRMNQLLGVFPLPPARVVHSIYRAANP